VGDKSDKEPQLGLTNAAGMTNLQEGVPVLGDFPLLPNTFYSIELMAEHFIPERNATVMFPLEEDVRFDDGGEWSWVYRRQEQFHLVKPR
jgi:hypothetical protein